MKTAPAAVCPPGWGQKPHAGRLKPVRTSNADRLISFITQLTFLAVWKTLTTLSAPVARLLALYVWAGRSTLKLASWVQRVIWHTVGWLAGPAWPGSQWLRHLGRQFIPLDVRKWHVVVAMVVMASLANSLVKKWRESFDERLRQLRQIQERMQTANSYPEWREFAQQLDKMGHVRGGDSSGKIRESLYDSKLLAQKLQHLQSMRESGNVKEMMFALRTDLIRNIANVAKSQLHEYFHEVPSNIRAYIQEVKAQLAMLTDWPEGGVDVDEKLAFFKETRHAYGRTALLLSGGGSLGSFHIGVVKALYEHTMLPRVLAGSSVGSIVAGIVATRTDDELRETFRKLDNIELSFFNNSRAVELVHSFLQQGALHDISFLQRKLKGLIGNYTFLEAYERTGRILNVSVCPADTNEPARLLNYLTAPHALIWSAVACSSAFPGLFHPQDLLARNAHGEEVRFSVPSQSDNVSRRWRDGSLELDLPTFLLSEMFNCNHFIVSQTNPHIVPLLQIKKNLSRRWANLLELELRHRCAQMQWILPDWFPTKWLTLFTQPWEGDITVVLPTHLWNLGKTMVNPTTSDIMAASKAGELAIWEKLSAIETNCTIEATLDACLARLTNKVRERPLGGLTSRIPSWLSMSAIGQQAVASWGNPLDAGASPGGRLWGPRFSAQLPSAHSSLTHLPSVLLQQVGSQGSSLTAASALAAAAAAAAGSGNALAASDASPAAAAAALLATAQASVGAGAGSTSGGSGRAPATVSDALRDMADGANMGGLHRGYSYTAAAMHHAHLQQHGTSPMQQSFLQAIQQQQQQSPQLAGMRSTPGQLAASLAAAGLGAKGVPAKLQHEGMPDEQPPRVTSWGSNDVADSVSDFPASSGSAGSAGLAPGATRCCGRLAGAAAEHSYATAAAQQQGAARVAAAAAAAASRRRAGLLATFDSKTCLVEEQQQEEEAAQRSSPRRRRSSSSACSTSSGASRRSGASSSGEGSGAPSEVLGQLDCCDSSVTMDIWASLLPLATSALALEAVDEGAGGLDYIAP